LLDKYERIVFSVPRKYGLSPADAADITQLTFTILVQSIDDMPEDSTLGAWLTTVARRHTWRLLKRARRENINKLEVQDESASALASGADEYLNHWELTEWLDHGLLLLSERCRNLLSALYLDPEQPSYDQVAGHGRRQHRPYPNPLPGALEAGAGIVAPSDHRGREL
jgi:RNA polymerase sigma factor (sigma-70 family)